MIRLLIAPTLFLMLTTTAIGANGDVLLSCNFDGPGTVYQVLNGCGFGAISGGQDEASIAAGEGWNGGKCYKGYYPGNYVDYDKGRFWYFGNVSGKQEITLVYYEKFSIPNSPELLWNTKSIRVYNSEPYYNAGINSQWSRQMGETMWLNGSGPGSAGQWSAANLAITSAVNTVNTNSGYCTSAGGSNYTCDRVAVAWPGMWGTSWHKVRIYLKAPTQGNRDGVIKMWFDEKLMYTLTNINQIPGQSGYWSNVNFRPSEDFHGGSPKPAFYHYYDDITIYEGYAPPISTFSPSTLPQPLNAPEALKLLN